MPTPLTPLTPDLAELSTLIKVINARAGIINHSLPEWNLTSKESFKESREWWKEQAKGLAECVAKADFPALIAAAEEAVALRARVAELESANNKLTGYATHMERDFGCDVGQDLSHTDCRRCQARDVLRDTLTKGPR